MMMMMMMMIIIIIIIIHFFICLCDNLNSEWPITKSAQDKQPQQRDNTGKYKQQQQ
jgi:hypothetical protein